MVSAIAAALPKIPPTSTTACVARKSRKIGSRTFTDSFTPRMFRVISPTMQKISKPIFHGCRPTGTKLNSASPAAAIETVIVST